MLVVFASACELIFRACNFLASEVLLNLDLVFLQEKPRRRKADCNKHTGQ